MINASAVKKSYNKEILDEVRWLVAQGGSFEFKWNARRSSDGKYYLPGLGIIEGVIIIGYATIKNVPPASPGDAYVQIVTVTQSGIGALREADKSGENMMTTRENSTGVGTHEYREGEFTITQMGNSQWYVFEGPDGKSATGQDFKTLRDARKWCKSFTEQKARG